jgi:DNA-binding response OmpR family regulator
MDSAASTRDEARGADFPGRFTRVYIETGAGELEARMSTRGNWELRVRRPEEGDWRLACRGDLDCGAEAAKPAALGRPEEIVRGPLRIEPAARTVAIDGRPLRFPNKEFTILCRLAAEPERVVALEDLAKAVYGDADPSRRRALKSHVCRLRRRLRAAGVEGMIVNFYSTGYRLWEDPTPAPRI